MTDPGERHVAEQVLRAIFEGALDAMLLADDNGRYVEANPAACVLFGLTREELLGRRVSEFAAPGYRPDEVWRRFSEQGRLRGRFPLVRPDGEQRELDFSAVTNVLPGLHLSILRDVTESRRAEELLTNELRENEARYRRIIETTSEGVWLIDVEGKTTFVNSHMAEMLGYTREEMLGRSVFSFMDEESQALAHAKLQRRQQGVAESHEHTYRKKDGTTLWALAKSNPIFDDQGRYDGALGLITDISERRDAEEARRHLASIVESSDDAIISRDLDGRIRTWNQGAEKLFLYSAREAIGRPIAMLYPPERSAELSDSSEDVNRGQTVTDVLVQAIRKDGSRVEVSVKASRLSDADGKVYGASVIARDLSEQHKIQSTLRRTEEQLRQAQKMEAVGSLAGGVAHDFNNLLSIILSYTNLIVEDLKPGDPIRADLEEVYKAGARAAELTRQLLAFSRQQMLQPTVLDLNQIVAGLQKMLARLLREDIVLSVLASPTVGKVHADQGQIEQVIMNLVVNARDAMPHGGNLTIETANVRLDADYAANHHGVVPGPYVMVAVTDTGVGMDRATQDRAFDPFFTTKEKGKGTGLGLSTVYGIVQQSGGHVWLYSEPGKGTTFKIYLPRTDRAADASPSLQPAPVTLRGTETVLLVEDDEQVRAIMRSILRKYGYNVLEAQNGGEAFLICEKYTARIHLLLTDVVMPRMSGRQLAERLALLRPEMQVLYVSGYTENSIVHHGVLDAGIAFLQKPITPDALLRKVREVLESTLHGSRPPAR
jgi:two-component system cell cycle sensor histidine kinase/response regulator CckA